MSPRFRRAISAAATVGAVAALVTLLAACTAHVRSGPPVEGPIIDARPPPPLEEEIPPQPYLGAVWVPGYWDWTGTRYTWVSGRWTRPPRAELYWYPGGWVSRGDGYVYIEGRWAPLDYSPRYRYVHPRRRYYRRFHRRRRYRRYDEDVRRRRYRQRSRRVRPAERYRSREAEAERRRRRRLGDEDRRREDRQARGDRQPRQPRPHRAPPARE